MNREGWKYKGDISEVGEACMAVFWPSPRLNKQTNKQKQRELLSALRSQQGWGWGAGRGGGVDLNLRVRMTNRKAAVCWPDIHTVAISWPDTYRLINDHRIALQCHSTHRVRDLWVRHRIGSKSIFVRVRWQDRIKEAAFLSVFDDRIGSIKEAAFLSVLANRIESKKQYFCLCSLTG